MLKTTDNERLNVKKLLNPIEPPPRITKIDWFRVLKQSDQLKHVSISGEKASV